jgi:hypothetical protein
MKKSKIILIIGLTFLMKSCSPASFYGSGKMTYSKNKEKTIKQEDPNAKSSKITNSNKSTLDVLSVENQKAAHENKTSETIYSSINEEFNIVSKKPTVFEKKNTNSIPTDSCDRITLKNGEEISGKVTDVGLETVTYIACDNLNGPKYDINQSNILLIVYSNGKREKFTTPIEKPKVIDQSNLNDYRKRTPSENMILAGFILSMVGIPLFILAVPTVLGLIFSWSGLIRGRRDSQLADNESLAVASIVVSGIMILAAIILGIISLFY